MSLNQIRQQAPSRNNKPRINNIVLIVILGVSMWWSMYMYDGDARYMYPAEHLPAAMEQFINDMSDFAADFIYAVKTC